VICDDMTPLLSDLADGTLAPSLASDIERHLETCARCRATLADLREIRQMAATLERRLPPDRVWGRIRETLSSSASEDARDLVTVGVGPMARGWRSQLALAAAALLVVAAVVGLWIRENRTSETPQLTVAQVEPEGPVDGSSDVVVAAARDFESVIEDLEYIARTEGGALDPDLAITLNENLAIVDQAIGDARGALEDEPQDEALRRGLLDVFRSKVDLLEQMVMLINEMRQGNQAEAAEIIGNIQSAPN